MPSEVTFYENKDYDGASVSFGTGDLQHILTGGKLALKYPSVKIASGASLFVWNHYNGSLSETWEESLPDISAKENAMCFEVLGEASWIVEIRFKDNTGAPDMKYSLVVKCADIGDVTLLSNEQDSYTIVGTMPPGGRPVTTALYVRDTSTGEYVDQGSAYFILDGDKVVIDEKDNWPKHLEHEQDDSSKFTITLISV